MKKKSKYPQPTRDEMRSCCIRCRRLIVQTTRQSDGTTIFLSERKIGGFVLDFDDNTGEVTTRRRAVFDIHQCKESDINFHKVYLVEKKYRLEREANPDYRPGDSLANLNWLDDDVLKTLNYDCPQCDRKEGEKCRSMVKYKDGRVVDNKNCHKVRRILALKMQGLAVRWDARRKTYELYTLPVITKVAQNGSSQGS